MPTNPFSQCIEFSDKRSNATFKDKKAQPIYVFPNTSNDAISGLRVDGCLLENNIRCDYLLLNHNDNKSWAVFIELKGSDLLHAVRQIDSSINQLSSQLHQYTLHGRIVLTKTNTVAFQSTEYINLRARFKKLGGTFESINIKLIEKTLK
jgi:hypothetical protein